MIPIVSSDYPSLPPPSRLQLLGRIASHVWQQVRNEGLADGLRVLLGAGRLFRGRGVMAELYAIPAFSELMAAQPQADVLFFISHRHFLSRGFRAAERAASVVDHFRFEQARFTPALLHALQGDGLRLWRHVAGSEVRLRANADTRHEGPLSVVLSHGGKVLHELSFAWVDAERLGPEAGNGPVLFATRSQTVVPSDAPALARFRTEFPQNSPAHFVLAALNGVAAAVGQQRIVGVRGVCQIAFEPACRDGFQRSYDELWQAFGGRPLGRHGVEMPVPAIVTPLIEIKAKHRARARQRREHWRQLAEASAAALSPYLRL